MKTLLVSLPVIALLASGCTTTPEQNTILGAVGGAAAGSLVSSKDDRTKGALLGAAAGAVAGTMLGQHNTGSSGGSNRNQCYYADGRGGTYIANC